MFLFEVSFQGIILGLCLMIIFAVLIYLLIELNKIKKATINKYPITISNGKLAIQAYERLALLTDRISLKNLVARVHTTNYTVQELEAGLTQNIRDEFDHNITQQIYVAPEVWKAVCNLKEQNIYIINQLAASLPPQADAIELSKSIIEYASGINAELSGIVLDAIQYEVKKII